MKRRDFVQVLGAGCLGIGGAVPRIRSREDVFVERWSWAMGQPVHVMVFAGSEQEGLDACAAATRLRDAALATAANTESIVRYGSLVAGHVMDPATGWPARALKQATVVTRSAVAADALSTAMLVTGRRPAGVLKAYSVQHT